MNIEFVGKDLNLTDALKQRIERRLGKIEARLSQKLFVRIKVAQESTSEYSCSVHFNARHDFNAQATADDLFKAADAALSKVERQVGRLNERGPSTETIRPSH